MNTPTHDPAYVANLATELNVQRPDLLTSAENDLALLRARLAIVATWIHNQAYDDTARRALAQALGLPEPTHRPVQEKPHG
ncbi:hypothetical protein ACFVOR_37415 [Streptomyces sp. NPDC057837]|uniref:hypothetical protein n=1 Tax=Streptomyces sp. NPDC057837 TaxID=3346260 RepID=UPI0036CF0326